MSTKKPKNDDVKNDDDTTNPSATPPPAPPPAPTAPPAWVTSAKMLCPRASDGNGAWTDYFKEALPAKPVEQWSGPKADYGLYEGGRVLVAYPSGFFAVMTIPQKPVQPGRQR